MGRVVAAEQGLVDLVVKGRPGLIARLHGATDPHRCQENEAPLGPDLVPLLSITLHNEIRVLLPLTLLEQKRWQALSAVLAYMWHTVDNVLAVW